MPLLIGGTVGPNVSVLADVPVEVLVYILVNVHIPVDVDVTINVDIDVAVVAACPSYSATRSDINTARMPIAIVGDDRPHCHANTETDN